MQEATLGAREHDLSEYVDSAGRVARGLDRSPARLKSLIADFNTAAGAFAREAGSLEDGDRGAAADAARRAARPGGAERQPAPAAALRPRPAPEHSRVRRDDRRVACPFLRQASALVSREELRGLAADLRPTVPPLVRLTRRTPGLLEELRAGSGCENEVLHAWSNDTVPDPNFPASGPVYQEAPKPLPGLSGESRSGDANGPYVHVLASAGDRTVSLGNGQLRAGAVPDPRHQPAQAREAGRRCGRRCRARRRSRRTCDTIAGPGEPTVSQGLPNTAEARARYARAKATAVRWVEREVRLRGLEDLWRVEDSP